MDLHQIILAVAEVAQETAQAVEPLTEHAEEGILGTLGINWKLFLAQLVNFGIVLFVFWKWVVKPLGSTLTERQERIEKGLKYSETMEEEKKKFDEWKTTEMRRTRVEADKIMRATTDEANNLRQVTIVEAGNQASKLMQQTKASIEAEKDKAMREIKQEAAALVVAAAEKILRGKLDQNKDKELISESLRSLK